MGIFSAIKDLLGQAFQQKAKQTYSADLDEIATEILIPNEGVEIASPAHEQSVIDLITEKLQNPSFDINGLTPTGSGDTTILHLSLLLSPRVTDFVLSTPGVNPNTREQSGFTPLIEALSYTTNQHAISLLNHPDINVNIKDNGGRTAAHHVLWSSVAGASNDDDKTIEMLQMLIDRGADKQNIQDTVNLFASWDYPLSGPVAEFVDNFLNTPQAMPQGQLANHLA